MNPPGTPSSRGIVQSWFWWLCRWPLGLVFVWAGGAKLGTSPTAFADSIAAFHLLPAPLIVPMTLALPVLEILVGAALWMNRTCRLGAFGASFLSGLFLIALGSALLRRLPVDCACFGAGVPWLPLAPAQRIWFDLIRDLFLLLAALGTYRHQLGDRSFATVP